MATNELKPFATDPAAVVYTPAEYAALTKRITGYVDGIVLDKEFNTPHRQSSFVAAMIGQFTADYSGADVLDNGNVATFETNFADAIKKSVQSLLQNGLLHYAVDTDVAANSITFAAATPPFTTLTAGLTLLVKVLTANTSTVSIVLPNALGTVPVINPDGTALSAGQLKNGGFALVSYDGASFQLLASTSAGGGSVTISNLAAGEGIAVSVPASIVTLSIASPAVVSWVGHGLTADTAFQFTTTGALPTGVSTGTNYYVRATGLAADSFQFAASVGGAAINTSGTQSGVHTATANTASRVNLNFPGLTTNATIADTDTFAYYRGADGKHRAITWGQVKAAILAAITFPPADAPLSLEAGHYKIARATKSITGVGVGHVATAAEINAMQTDPAGDGPGLLAVDDLAVLRGSYVFGYGIGQYVELAGTIDSTGTGAYQTPIWAGWALGATRTGAQLKGGSWSTVAPPFYTMVAPGSPAIANSAQLGVATVYQGTLPPDAAVYQLVSWRVIGGYFPYSGSDPVQTIHNYWAFTFKRIS